MDADEDIILPNPTHPAYGSIDGFSPAYSQAPDTRSAVTRPRWAAPNASGDTSALLLSHTSFDNLSSSQSALLLHHGSRGQFSRQRRRSAKANTSDDYRGDFVIHDFINEKTRSYVLEHEYQREQIGPTAHYIYTAKIYFVLIAMGIGAGIIAAGLDLSVEWLSDIKFGICTTAWYLTREMCCKLQDNEHQCQFTEWAAILASPFDWFFPPFLRNFLCYAAIAVAFGSMAAFLVKRFAPHAAGSGVPEIKTVLSGVVIRGYLSGWTFIIKLIGLAFSVASGLNLGKEGPFVHLVSVLANILATSFEVFRENHSVMMEFVTVGTAAGVSVAFNAPIGGVLFAFEEAASFFPNRVLWRSFFASALAELTLKLVNPFFNGKAVMFQVDRALNWYWFEMIPFFFIGALGGVIGSVFIHYNVKWSKFRIHDRFVKRSPILEITIIVLITVLLQYPIPFLRLTNTEILALLFSECNNTGSNEEVGEALICNNDNISRAIIVLAYASVAKLFLTILTFGARVPAGLFIPSMTIGACAGRIIGMLMKWCVQSYPELGIFAECQTTSICVLPSIYALVGASSTLAGVTQVSVSLVVIMFELTGGLNHLLPTMFGILAAKMVCNIGGMEGIYDMHINIKRYPFLDTKHHVSHTVAARVIMRPPRAIIPEKGATLGFLRQMMNDYSYYGFPIVRKESDMILTGNIVRKELSHAIARATEDPRVSNDTVVVLKGEFDVGEQETILSATNEVVLNLAGFRDRYLCQVAPETPISDVYDCFSSLGVRMVFVTRHGELLGLISKKDIIAYCDAAGDVPRKYFR